jgi:hypothetical protein
MSDWTVDNVNLKARRVLMGDGVLAVIWNMFDEWGEETEESSEAVAIVANHPSGGWLAVSLEVHPPRKPH